MNVALWAVQGLLALIFVVSGSTKVARPRRELQSMLPYVEDLSDVQLKALGLLEILAAIGMVLPSVFKLAPFLTPIAAVGLVERYPDWENLRTLWHSSRSVIARKES